MELRSWEKYMPKNMPPTVLKSYERWISHYPQSWHPTDLQHFYLFVRELLRRAKKERSRYWLEENLKADCPKLSDADIAEYGAIYEHIKDFNKVGRSHTAKLIALDERDEYIKNFAQR